MADADLRADVHVTLDAVHNVARAEVPIPAGDWPGAPVAALRALIEALQELAEKWSGPTSRAAPTRASTAARA